MHALKDHPEHPTCWACRRRSWWPWRTATGAPAASSSPATCTWRPAQQRHGLALQRQVHGTPMILTAGQQEQGHGLTEPPLYDPLVPIAAPLVKWAVEVTRLEDLPRIVRRAAKVAMTPPTGPVFISLPGDILNAEAGIGSALDPGRSRSRRPTPRSTRLAKRLLEAERPVIIVGDEIVRATRWRPPPNRAETLGAPVYQQSVTSGAHFLSDHLCFIVGSRATRAVRGFLSSSTSCPARRRTRAHVVWNEVEPLPDCIAGGPRRLNRLGDGREPSGRDGRARRCARGVDRARRRVLEEGRRAARRRRPRRPGRSWRESDWTAGRGDIGAAGKPRGGNRSSATGLRCRSPRRSPRTPSWSTRLPAAATWPSSCPTGRYSFHALASAGIGWGVPAAVTSRSPSAAARLLLLG